MRVPPRVLGLVLVLLACGDSTAPDVQRVGPAGGTVTLQGLTIEVPAGALDTEVEITADAVSTALLTDPAWLGIEGTAYDLGPDGLTFAEPVQISIAYSASDVPEHFGESELHLLRLDGTPTLLEGTVDAGAGLVHATTDHFSTFVAAVEQGSYQRVACPSLQPAAASGVPLDDVALGALPQSFEPPLLVVVASGSGVDEGTGFGMVDTTDTGEPYLRVPIHPSASVEGGSVSLSVTDGTVACEPFDFEILPLPAASGELGGIVSLLQAMLDQQASLLDSTGDEIRATPVDEIPEVLIPWVVMQAALDDPSNPTSLSAIAAGTSSVTDTRLDLLEPILARTGLRESLSQALAAGRPDGPARAPRGGMPAAAVTIGVCAPDLMGDDTNLLNYCMGRARDAALSSGGATGQILRDLKDNIATLGLVPGLAVPADIIAFLTWLAVNETDKTAALLPSTLGDMVLHVGTQEFREDDETAGTWSASVTAHNAGWDVGKELLEGLLGAAGTAGIFDKAQVAGPDVNGVLAYILTNPVAGALLEDGPDTQIPPEEYGPFPVTSEDWSESRIATGSAVELIDHTSYVAREVGSATLAVVTTADAIFDEEIAFGGQEAAASAEITVKPIQMTITPDDVNLSPNEPMEFTVRVIDAKYPDEIAVDRTQALQGTASDPVKIADGFYSVTYMAPLQPNPEPPELLVVENTATTGARPDRDLTKTATIRFGGLRITTFPPPCLDFGAPLQFEVGNPPLGRGPIGWSASAGTINSETGAFIAPDVATTVEITAFLVDFPDVKDSITVLVGCLCTGLLVVDGISPQATAVEFTVDDGAVFEVGWVSDPIPDDGQSAGAQFQLVPPVPFGQTGEYDVHGGGLFTDADLGTFFTSDETGPLLLTLTANEGGERVEGSVTGTVHASWKSGPVPGQELALLTFSFDVRADPFLTWNEGTVQHLSCLVPS